MVKRPKTVNRSYGLKNQLFVGGLLALGLLAGCSGIKTFPNTLDKNLHVHTETDSGSLFSGVRTAVDIYRVNADCRTEYEGTVQLREPNVEIGIPAGRASYLVFVFANSSFFGSSGKISYNTLLTPRSGRHYKIKVRYKDDIYNVTIQEMKSGKALGREVERRELSTCKVRR
jgi:hypothetical protein